MITFLFKNKVSSYINRCERCFKKYTDIKYKWCKPCQIFDLKKNFPNWTSGNEEIDYCIQEMQINIDHYDDTVFKWIPYNQFTKIEKVNRRKSIIIYSANMGRLFIR